MLQLLMALAISVPTAGGGALAGGDRALAEADRALAERGGALAEADGALAEADRALAEADAVAARGQEDGSGVATAPQVPPDSLEYRGDQGALRVRAPRLAEAGIRVDGRLDEPAWKEAARLSGFTQYQPVEGIPATQPTEVRVLYTSEAIYFGIHARDATPSAVRASLTDRDGGVESDDWVRIILDTFHDATQAYVFYVNPLGIQADGLWVEGAEQHFGPPIDFNPDFLWESSGHVTEDGWVAEVRIPYVGLRFRDLPEQSWGINVARYIRRTEYESSWAPLTQNAANQLELNGALVGLTGLHPRRLMEVNPVATGKRTGERVESGAFEREPFSPELGVNARLGLASNLVLDATVNPDFSQVEADADQVAVNERFALYFPEKRPFFLDGTEVFTTPRQLVYTRAIVDPIGGAKLTGKTGAFKVGYLGAVDRSPVTFGGGSDDALFNLVRVQRDVGSGSNVGALYTDRTMLGGQEYNRVASVDTRLILAGRYTLTGQLAGAWSRERSDDGSARDLFGPLLYAQLARSGRGLSWNASVDDVDPEFRARSGFIPRVGDAHLAAEAQYTFHNEAGAFLEDWSPQLEADAYFDHQDLWAGRRYDEASVEAGLDISLRGANGGQGTVSYGYFSFDPADYAGYERPVGDGGYVPMEIGAPLTLLRVHAFGRSQPAPWLALHFDVSYGDVPIYAEASRGVELGFEPSAQLSFRSGLTADLSFTYARIHRAAGGLFSVAQIPRAKLRYQLTRALFTRAIVQYNLEERDALRWSDGLALRVGREVSTPEDRGELQYDLLLGYEPSPGTVVYAGWSRSRVGPNTYRPGALEPATEGLFLKVSYLLRL